jgi:hypothetical protein
MRTAEFPQPQQVIRNGTRIPHLYNHQGCSCQLLQRCYSSNYLPSLLTPTPAIWVFLCSYGIDISCSTPEACWHWNLLFLAAQPESYTSGHVPRRQQLQRNPINRKDLNLLRRTILLFQVHGNRQDWSHPHSHRLTLPTNMQSTILVYWWQITTY